MTEGKEIMETIGRNIFLVLVLPVIIGLVLTVVQYGSSFSQSTEGMEGFYTITGFIALFVNAIKIPRNYKIGLDYEKIRLSYFMSIFHTIYHVILCLIIIEFLPESYYVMWGFVLLGLVFFVGTLVSFLRKRRALVKRMRSKYR